MPRKQLERSLEQLARSGHGVVEYSREGDNIELTLERDVDLLTDEQAGAAADEGRLVATDTERWMGDSTLQAWIASRKILEHHPPPFVYCFPHGPIAQDHLADTSRFETAHDLHRWSGDLFWREFPVCRPSASLADAIDPSTGMVVDEDPIQSWRVDRDGVLYRTTATVTDSAVDSDLARFAVFSRAAVAHPELAELVPPKPRNAARCRTCKGAGWSARRGTEPRECDRCDGLGVAILRRY